MASSPFGCNANNLFGKKAKTIGPPAPPEPVVLEADKSQVITAIIPFGTRNAANIRKTMHDTIVIDGQRIFMYRTVNGWTNIHLESTELVPKLTCEPKAALKIAWAAFNNCPNVSTTTLKWKGQTDTLTYDDIDNMDFNPLPVGDGDGPDATTGNKTDAEVLHDMLKEMTEKVETLDTKLGYITDKLDYTYDLFKEFVNPSSDDSTGDDTAHPENSRSTRGEASSSKDALTADPTTTGGNKKSRRRGA